MKVLNTAERLKNRVDTAQQKCLDIKRSAQSLTAQLRSAKKEIETFERHIASFRFRGMLPLPTDKGYEKKIATLDRMRTKENDLAVILGATLGNLETAQNYYRTALEEYAIHEIQAAEATQDPDRVSRAYKRAANIAVKKLGII